MKDRVASVAVVLGAVVFGLGASPARADEFPAFTALTGHEFQRGGSSLALRPSVAPGFYELLEFRPTQVSPKVLGDWMLIGTVLLDEEDVTPLQEAGHFKSDGAIQLEAGGSLTLSVECALSAFAGQVILVGGEQYCFSGVLATTSIGGQPAQSCPPWMFVLPVSAFADMPMARADAARMASNASGSTDDTGGVNQDCFDNARGWDQCYQCLLACERDADRRRKVCRAGCGFFNWEAIAVGGGAGAVAGALCGFAIFSVPTAVSGGIAGGIGAAIIARAACLSGCDSTRDAEFQNCMDALLECTLAH